MRVRVLGPFEVLDGAGAVLPLGTPKQRTLCALLVLRADQVVTVDELVDELWPERPPSSAVANVRTYASNFRHVLAGAGPDGPRLDTSGPGYLLRLEALTFDLAMFRQAVRLGREAAAGGELAAAAGHFAAGNALWRGQPLADVRMGAALTARRVALRDERASTVEAFAEIEVRRGRADGVLPLLREHVYAAPARERGWELLISALHRGGDVAGALSAYASARAALVTHLGIEPGSRLRELHQAVLHGAPPATSAPADRAATSAPADRAATSAPADRVARTVIPAQLPSGTAAFAGRVDQLAQLDALLDSGGARASAVVISAIAGTAGVGKTALAIHWAHRVADRFSDGQLYVNLRGFDPSGSAMSPAEAVRGFLDAFEVPPQRIPASHRAQADLYRSMLAGKRVLVVLDNARDVEQVRPLLPGAPGCLAVVTSRNQLTGLVTAEGARPLTLDLLGTVEARDLLAQRLGGSRVTAEPAAVDTILTRCAGLPLAIAVVAARAATYPGLSLARLAQEVSEARDGLDAFAAEDRSTDVRAVLSWSYHALSAAAARLFRLLGPHPGPDIGVVAAASLTTLPRQQVTPLLAELVRAHLVNEHSPGRYAFHDLLRAYATELADRHDSDADRHAALHRVLDHYLHTACAAERLISPTRDPIVPAPPQPGARPHDIADLAQAMAWFTDECRVLLAAIARAADAGFAAHAWHLPWAMITFLDRRGRGQDAITTQLAAVEASQRLPDPSARALAHAGLARAYIQAQRFEDADIHCRQALRLFGELHDAIRLAHSHQTMTVVCNAQGRPDESLHHSRRAHELFQAAGNRAGQARALNGIGWTLSLLGDHRQGIVYCQRALGLSRELGDRFIEASTLDSLGHAHHHLGHYAEALDCFGRAVDVFRDLNDHREATTLDHAGDTHRAVGDRDAARAVWQQAVAIFDQLDHPDADEIRAKLRGLNATATEPRQPREGPG